MPAPLKKMSFSKVRASFFFILISVLLVAFVFLLRPFSYPLFWAAILAVLFYPFYDFLQKKIKYQTMSALISVVLVLCIILIPITIGVLLLVHQSVELYTSAVKGSFISSDQIKSILENSPLAPFVNITELNQLWASYVNDATKTVSGFFFQNTRALANVFSNVKDVTQSSVWFLFQVFIMLYSLYYFFKDGRRILERVKFLSPLGNGYEEMFYQKFRATSVSTLKTTFIIGGIQGVIGGLLFWGTGVRAPFVWGVIMMLFSILPGIGPFAVWVPAGVIMFLLGNTWQGVTILLVGMLVISTVDNLLRPPLLGKDTQMHPLVALLSTLGGILAFGISGFVIGPILASFFLAATSMYEYYYHRELGEQG